MGSFLPLISCSGKHKHAVTVMYWLFLCVQYLQFSLSACYLPLSWHLFPSLPPLFLHLSAHHPISSLSPLSSVAVCLSPSLLIVADYSRGLVRGHRQPSCSIWTCFLPRKPWPDETTHTHMRTHTQ